MATSISKKISGTLHKIMYNNFLVNGYFARKRKEVLNKAFLGSKDFDQLFLTKVNNINQYQSYLNDAQDDSANFNYRHRRVHKILGGWRWKGLWQYKNKILNTLFDPQLQGIDFGGANGPVSLHATIVDFDPVDAFNRPVPYKSLKDVDFKADYIFSSHTLEHISDLDSIFKEMIGVLKPTGRIIFHVPAYTCIRWRSGLHSNRKFNDHAWTFFLSETPFEEGIHNPKYIDEAVARHFEIEEKAYVGDNSIMILGKPK
ncbi:MAG: methyltransferase domain-containing protein [Bacteroidota bacterium]